MTLRWRGITSAVLSLAAFAGALSDVPSARAFGPGCACTSSGCTHGGPLSAYGDGADAMSLPGEGSVGDQYNLGEAAPAQTNNMFAALDAPGAYIDSAIVASRFRIRFDAAYNNPHPDRAEFFYGQCGLIGPPNLERDVDYQEIVPYLEWAFSDRFSLFVETPVRFINPEINNNSAGFSDMNAGGKFAFIACPDEYLTAQVRVYAPTGDASRGLGNDHVSIEPSILYFRRLTDRLALQAEVRDWIPISGSLLQTDPSEQFAGNIIRYGVGFGYDILNSCDFCDPCANQRLTAVTEVVGWSIIDGYAFDFASGTPIDQSGVTIVNAKFGLRYTSGADSLYAGYGTALTNQVWYEDVIRLEYQRAF